MNHYGARQREDTKRWDYTCSNRRTGTYPIGYCSGWHESTLEELEEKWGHTASQMFKDQEESRPQKDLYHKNGHDTKEEAQACYKSYLLKNDARLDREWDGTQHNCLVCKAWTSKFAMVNQVSYNLCDEHRNLEELEKLVSVGEAWSSY